MAWTATSNQTWCTVTPASGKGSGAVTVNVSENTALEARTATVTLTAGELKETVNVTQLGVTPVLSVNITEIYVSATATDSSIVITSNLAWTATSSAAWCSVTPASGNGSGAVTVSMVKNTTTSIRTATVTVKANNFTKTVVITQLGETPVLSVSTTEINAPVTAASYTVEITSNLAWTVRYTYSNSNNFGWCSITPFSGNGSGTITIDISPYGRYFLEKKRTVIITVQAGSLTETIYVNQSFEPKLSSSVSEIHFNVVEASYKIVNDITANTNYTITSSETWCSYSYGEIIVAQNTTNETRTAIVTVQSTEYPDLTCFITVIQDAEPVYMAEISTSVSGFLAVAKKIIVNWGDGKITEHNNIDSSYILHQYSTSEFRTIRIYGEELTYLRVSSVTGLNVNGCKDLTGLHCSGTFTSLDLSNNTELTYLLFSSSILTSLDLSKNTKLTHLFYEKNYRLISLDLSNNTNLTSLECSNNQLTSLDVSNNTNLTSLKCSDNQLTSLDLSNNTKLTYLECYRSSLTSLDVSNSTKLTYLNCSFNQLTSLDVSNHTELTTLGCSSNRLTSLDISGCSKLSTLGCSSNQLTSLDVSNHTELTTLSCSSNRLTSLDINGCNKLGDNVPSYSSIVIEVSSNQLSATALNEIFAALPRPRLGLEDKVCIHIYDNPGTSTCNRSIAINKYWLVSVAR
jgi:Leucine-rich repeat (LRR) protein